MTKDQIEQQIAKDLDLCGLVEALGSKANKRKASAQRKACYAQIKAWNDEDGSANISDEELLIALSL